MSDGRVCPDCKRTYHLYRIHSMQDVCTNYPPDKSYSGANNCVRVAYELAKARIIALEDELESANVASMREYG